MLELYKLVQCFSCTSAIISIYQCFIAFHATALGELGISCFDVIFLAFPAIPEDSTLTFAEVAKPFWRVIYCLLIET